MRDLTISEKKVLNNLSQENRLTVKLGDKIQEIIDSLPEVGTPTNAVFATETLSITGVVVHGETLNINNPARERVDIYEFLADVAQTKTLDTNIAVNIYAKTTKSTGALTIDTQPTSGDTMTIGLKRFTFVPVGTDTADGEISIGTDLTTAQEAIVAAINGTDGVNNPHPLVSAGNFVANASVITALIGGVAGDAISTTSIFTAVTNVFAAITLGTGSDCSAANAVTALISAITTSDTQNVGATKGVGSTIILTADDAGEAGNDIEIDTTMINGSFTEDAEALSGGVNGTISEALKTMIDDTYFYICIDENLISGTNWRRVALGSAY